MMSSNVPIWANCFRYSEAILYQQPLQQRLLRVQPVARLLEDRTAVAVEHVAGDLLAAVGRQAVQDAGVRRRLRQQRGVDLVAGEPLSALVALGFLAHAGPDAG